MGPLHHYLPSYRGDPVSALPSINGLNKGRTSTRQEHLQRDAVSEGLDDTKFQWIPGYCEIPGDELADPKSAAKLPGPIHCRSPVSNGSSCAQIPLCFLKDPLGKHKWTIEVYEAISKERESQIKTRIDQTTLAKLRSGHSMGLTPYHHGIGGAPDRTCPLCGKRIKIWSTGLPSVPLWWPDDGNYWVVIRGVWIAWRDILWGCSLGARLIRIIAFFLIYQKFFFDILRNSFDTYHINISRLFFKKNNPNF